MSETPLQRIANLTREEARRRAGLVSEVSYDLELSFRPLARGYDGRTRVRFMLKEAAPLFLDFIGKEVRSVTVNGRTQSAGGHDGRRLHLDPASLVAGSNEVDVITACDYDAESVGLHHFRDPQDGCEYLYTDFEPYDANRVFPSFDQPDLKAIFQVRVEAPADWEVISNTPVEEVASKEGARTWRFSPTHRISTYLVNVCAGHWQVWEDPAARIPSRLFARRSLGKHMEAPEISEITRKGFEFFEAYFDVTYAFGKYDQIFVPEFKTGAMENVGAVVITDSMLFRHKPTAEDRVNRAVLLLHEMAHMWFGNLVTMRWWDGLWLNESFATYLSFLAAEKVCDYPEIWEFFDARLRRWAVWQDELPTTHPIEMDVAETSGCFNNFDGITYGKGCCVLKQLAYRLGPEKFRAGVSQYLQQYAWSNTENLDFTRALEKASGVDLGAWQQSWLHRSGLNALGAVLETSGGRIDRLELVQRPGNGDRLLREHRTRVGLFNEKGGSYEVTKTLEVTVSGELTMVDEAQGLPAPAFVHPNFGSEAYAKLFLDPHSLATVESGLPRFRDRGVRSGILDILRGMLLDAELPPARYLRIVTSLFPGEPSTQILDALSRTVLSTLDRYLGPDSRQPVADDLHELSWNEVEREGHAPELRRLWLRYMIGSAYGTAALARLERILDGKIQPRHLEVDQEVRWDLLARLLRQRPDPARLEAEERRDATDRGSSRAMEIRASLPDAATKQRLWQQFLEDRETSVERLKAGFRTFHQPDQDEVLAPYADRYLEDVPRLIETRTMEFAMSFTGDLFPAFETRESFMKGLATLIESSPPALARILRERRDDLQRLRRVRTSGTR